MRSALLLALTLLLPLGASTADAPTITDPTGLDDTLGTLLEVFVPPPQVDMDRVDVVVVGDHFDVSWHVVDLTHKTTTRTNEYLAFSLTFVSSSYDVVDLDAAVFGLPGYMDPLFGFYGRDWDGGRSTTLALDGTWDWANDTVTIHVPLSLFQQGDTLQNTSAWSFDCIWEPAGCEGGNDAFHDRAPNQDAGPDVQLP